MSLTFISGKLILCTNNVHTKNKRESQSFVTLSFMWSHLGLNQGPPDYESGALTS